MDISSIMARDLASLQQTVQMSLLNKQLNDNAVAALNSLTEMMPAAQHPDLGQNIDLKA